MSSRRWAARRSPWLVGAGLLVFAIVAFVRQADSGPALRSGAGDDVRRIIAGDADSLDAALTELSHSLAGGSSDSAGAQRVRTAFRESRARCP